MQLQTRRRPPQGYVELMTEKQVLGFQPASRLEHVGDEHSEPMQDHNIDPNDVMICLTTRICAGRNFWKGHPGKTATAMSFNGKLRDELLNGEIFYSLKETQIVIEQWRKHYNTIRPHLALNYRPPAPQTFAPLAHHLDEIMPMQ